MLKGFKEFILRGNVLDLAVAVVIGAAFNAVVSSVVTSVFNPLIGAVFNASSLAKSFPLSIPTTAGGHAVIEFGAVIAALIQFLVVAVVVYFVFVMPMNIFKRRAEMRKAAGQPADKDTPPTELEVLEQIRDLLAKGSAPQPAGPPET